MGQQSIEITRVKSNIGDHVKSFVKERFESGNADFCIRELHDYIFKATQIAPASPDRILRQLRLEGQYDYVVTDHRNSLYRITRFGVLSQPPTAESVANVA